MDYARSASTPSTTMALWALSNSSDRDVYVKNWLLNLPTGASLLDAGAGMQRYKEFASHLQYTSQDFGEYTGGEFFGQHKMGEWDSTKCDILCDITNIPLESNSFDFIMCTEVFEHLASPQDALRELVRILKPNGTMLITAPFRCLYHQEPHFYYSGFSRYWYEHFGNEFNLEIQSIIPNGNYFTDIAQEVFRTTGFGGILQRTIAKILATPYLAYLFAIDKFSKTRTPESCWGYHVVLTKGV